jgi:hypothetical protein
MKRSTLLMSVVAIVTLLASGAMAKQDKVDLCHVPGGNPLNAQVVSVAAPAAIAHLDKHFDAPGSAAVGLRPDCACDCWGEYVACSLELGTDDPRCILDQPTPSGTCSVEQLVTCAGPLQNCLWYCAEACFPDGSVCCSNERCTAPGECTNQTTGGVFTSPCPVQP